MVCERTGRAGRATRMTGRPTAVMLRVLWSVIACMCVVVARGVPPAQAEVPPDIEGSGELNARPYERIDIADEGTSDPWARLGDYERAQVDPILVEMGARPDRSPFGKVVGTIYVRRLAVFGPDEPVPDVFNRFHVLTREVSVRRAITLEPGDEFSELGYRDAERQLRNPNIYSTVMVLPIESDESGVVDLLVVTRDVWSLLPTWFFTVSGVLTQIHVGLVETNFLGRNEQLALNFDWGQGYWQVGPAYYSPRLGATRWSLSVSPTLVWDREVSELEGYGASVNASLPLYETASRVSWDVGVSASDRNGRRFVGNAISRWDDPETPDEASVEERWRSQQLAALVQGTRSFGVSVKHNVTAGARASWSSNAPLPREVVSPELLARFVEERLPRSETIVGPLLGYQVYENRWMTVRNVATFGLGEEVRLGPSAEVQVRYSEPSIGSTRRFVSLGAGATTRHRLGRDGWLQMSADQTARVELDGDGVQDLVSSGRLGVVGPWTGGGRGVMLVRATQIERNGANVVLTSGADVGLRGYPSGYQQGDRQWQANLEWRTPGLHVLSTRLGAVFFVDQGSSWTKGEEVSYSASVGTGLRWMIPQVGPQVRSLDIGFPLVGGRLWRVGRTSIQIPIPSLTISFGQVLMP